MAKKSKSPWNILKNKKNKLDWHAFNFLENLLVFCPLKERTAKESGIHFRIGSKAEDKALCILFEIDRKHDPLIREKNQPRPDYLVFYADGKKCICTIVEMKGKGEKELGRGIEQITSFRDRLREGMKEHLPNFKIRFQGILLTPPNSQVPLKKIAQEGSKGFVIAVLQHHHKAELYPYVSKENKMTEKYKHEAMSRHSEPGFIEQILTERALPVRIEDDFHASNFSAKRNRKGIFINCALSDQGDYAALMADNDKAEIGVKENEAGFLDLIRKESGKIGLKDDRRCSFVKID